MREQLLTISQVAKVLNVKTHRITYALANGLVEDVRQIGGRRLFTADDIHRLAEHFSVDTALVDHTRSD